MQQTSFVWHMPFLFINIFRTDVYAFPQCEDNWKSNETFPFYSLKLSILYFHIVFHFCVYIVFSFARVCVFVIWLQWSFRMYNKYIRNNKIFHINNCSKRFKMLWNVIELRHNRFLVSFIAKRRATEEQICIRHFFFDNQICTTLLLDGLDF